MNVQTVSTAPHHSKAASVPSKASSASAGADEEAKSLKWTAAEKALLIDLWGKGLSAEDISAQMPGRSPSSVQQRALRQSLPGRGRADDGSLVPRLPRRADSVIDGERSWKLVPRMRVCLGECGKEFLSEHSGIRMCHHCKSREESHGMDDCVLHV